MWYDQRAGRVTASNIRAACHTHLDKPAVSLLKKLCYPVAYKDQNTPHSLRYLHIICCLCYTVIIVFFKEKPKSMYDICFRWGNEHEGRAVEEYSKVMEGHHTNFAVRKGGGG